MEETLKDGLMQLGHPALADGIRKIREGMGHDGLLSFVRSHPDTQIFAGSLATCLMGYGFSKEARWLVDEWGPALPLLCNRWHYLQYGADGMAPLQHRACRAIHLLAEGAGRWPHGVGHLDSDERVLDAVLQNPMWGGLDEASGGVTPLLICIDRQACYSMPQGRRWQEMEAMLLGEGACVHKAAAAGNLVAASLSSNTTDLARRVLAWGIDWDWMQEGALARALRLDAPGRAGSRYPAWYRRAGGERVAFLLSVGAKWSSSPRAVEVASPLAQAVNLGCRVAVEEMVKAGVDPKWQDPFSGRSILMLGGGRKASFLAQQALPEDELRQTVNWQDEKGRTALHLAMHAASSKTVDWLVQMGASITIKDAKGRAPLQAFRSTSIKGGEEYAAICTSLLAHGHREALVAPGAFLLHQAAGSGSLQATKTLLALGVDPNEKNRKKRSALGEALHGLHTRLTQEKDASRRRAKFEEARPLLLALVDAGARYEAIGDSFGRKGDTGLHWACQLCLPEAVDFFLELGARVDEKNADGLPPDAVPRTPWGHKGADAGFIQAASELMLRMQQGGLDMARSAREGPPPFELMRQDAGVEQAYLELLLDATAQSGCPVRARPRM